MDIGSCGNNPHDKTQRQTRQSQRKDQFARQNFKYYHTKQITDMTEYILNLNNIFLFQMMPVIFFKHIHCQLPIEKGITHIFPAAAVTKSGNDDQTIFIVKLSGFVIFSLAH